MTALRKDLIREIKNSKNRFLSIAILIALAVAFLSGLKATAPDMKNTGDEYLDKQQLMDIQVLSTLGLTKDDIKALGAQDNIERAVGAYCIDAWAGDLVAKAYSITDGMNLLTVTSGRMPESPDECIVDKNLLEKMKISVGDSITIDPSDDYEDCLTHKNFTIVGTAVSPYYISVERGSASIGSGNVRAYVYLPEGAFDLDYYTVAYAKVKGAQELTAFTERSTTLKRNWTTRKKKRMKSSPMRSRSLRMPAESWIRAGGNTVTARRSWRNPSQSCAMRSANLPTPARS